ncbi:serine protease 16 precursor [Nasonia vitripennis]|uniref:CLIP domain-containing serine protease n=1 Tax=Nasonia vitripennis TaxID=7425 RepID=A0A7M6UD36_NASVI|nr:serine protease 16 precursor [Nasonia vitripennis]
MGYKIGGALLVLGLAVLGIARAQNNGPCRNPNNEIGECINLKQCPPLIAILTAQPRDPAGIQFLQRSQCGFEGRDPMVCCVQGSATRTTPGGNNGAFTSPVTERTPQVPSSNLLPTDCGRDLSNRIVGGNATELDEFPWMALLEYRKPSGKTTACGGALISKRYILTAAHCLKGRSLPSTWTLQSVRLGEYNTATNPDCIPDGSDGFVCADEPINVGIDEQIVHEDYAPYSNDQRYDIALLRLSRDVAFTNYIKPICLPTSSDIGQKLTVAGWGKTETRSESDVKLKVNVPLVDKQACGSRYSNAGVSLGEGQICAGGVKGRDSCRGDSGGPLMQQDRLPDGTLRWSEAGVVSFGPSPCGMEGWPGVYTKVYDYMPWIISKLRP